MKIYKDGVCREATKEEIEIIKSIKTPPEVIIEDLRRLLSETQEDAVAFDEGVISAEEYEPIRKQRQEWLRQIRELKAGGEG